MCFWKTFRLTLVETENAPDNRNDQHAKFSFLYLNRRLFVFIETNWLK